jgi:hypothetical protein
MKRVFITVAALCAILQAQSQTVATDSTGYKSRKLKLDEINLVSSYYTQDGNNASVTGGIGSEKLTDLANMIDLKWIKYDKKSRKHSFDAEIGIDHYTSASSDKIDLNANTSASYSDNRLYPSLNWSMENEEKGNTVGAGVSASVEWDYTSFGGNVNFSKKTANKSGEFSAKFQAYLDKVKLILPIELRTPEATTNGFNGYASRNTFVGSLTYSQIINKNFQVMFLLDLAQQQGYLSLPFHRVYFADGSVHQENLPSSRFKLPIGIRANYFLGDNVIIKANYRFYTDDWGLQSHTINIETPIKISPFFSISPFYRFYTQSAIKYFEPYAVHTTSNEYYTSNFDDSKFNTNFFGTGIRYAPPKGVLGIQRFSMLEMRYGHYDRTTGLVSDIISLNLKFK